ncbi:hypothetical protein TNCV_4529771 [Trichonephila clavipes]|nr:hypothetical protein TNCV_4529771 [Trichonephila clavipes]
MLIRHFFLAECSSTCSLNDAVLPTGEIEKDETDHSDRGGLWDDATETVVASTRLVSFFVCHTLYMAMLFVVNSSEDKLRALAQFLLINLSRGKIKPSAS